MGRNIMELFQLLQPLLVLWIVAIGFAVMLKGTKAGVAVFWWPMIQLFRLLRRALWSILISLGRSIKGK